MSAFWRVLNDKALITRIRKKPNRKKKKNTGESIKKFVFFYFRY